MEILDFYGIINEILESPYVSPTKYQIYFGIRASLCKLDYFLKFLNI